MADQGNLYDPYVKRGGSAAPQAGTASSAGDRTENLQNVGTLQSMLCRSNGLLDDGALRAGE